MYDFDYLIDKIKSRDFAHHPFRHIYIEEFFSEEHFNAIVQSEEIAVPPAKSDAQLIDGLSDKGFKIISFPGCVTDREKYIEWRANGKGGTDKAREGFGMALRLYDPRTPILQELDAFLRSEKFNQAIADKFGIDMTDCKIDGGIQKYLDGYEISPHPDVRRKAATFMVNINPSPLSKSLDHHTHYMKLKAEREYVKAFWTGNPDIDRDWLPWDWAETVFQQPKNNSIVLFSPDNDTLHAVRANYDHLVTQRTQLYGNIWYDKSPATGRATVDALDILTRIGDAPLKKSKAKLSKREKFTRSIAKRINRLMGNEVVPSNANGTKNTTGQRNV